MTREVGGKLRRELQQWEPDAGAWIDSIPRLVDEVEAAWGISASQAPIADATLAWVGAVGDDAVLKVAWPHDESRDEAIALRVWDGDGAVRVLRHDAARWALLLERCVPGTALAEKWSPATIPVGVDLLHRLWLETDEPVQRLADLVRPWAAITRARAEQVPTLLDRGIVDVGCSLLAAMPDDDDHLLHGDFHPGNVLSATREPWLAIDPKPVVGVREWDAAVMTVHQALDATSLRERLALVSDLTGLDRERLRQVTLARIVEWAHWDAVVARDDAAAAMHAEQARLLSRSSRG